MKKLTNRLDVDAPHYMKHEPPKRTIIFTTITSNECLGVFLRLEHLMQIGHIIVADDCIASKMLNCEPKEWAKYRKNLEDFGLLTEHKGYLYSDFIQAPVDQAKEKIAVKIRGSSTGGKNTQKKIKERNDLYRKNKDKEAAE